MLWISLMLVCLSTVVMDKILQERLPRSNVKSAMGSEVEAYTFILGQTFFFLLLFSSFVFVTLK
jgi:hypothetical protein